jgi:hypothetical protein
MFDIIIKDGMDLNLIVDKYKEVLSKIIVNNFDLIEKESSNKLVIIYIISNCYTILLSNYFYIIELLQKNFGLNIKIFNEVTKIIKEEMAKFVSIVILAYLHEVMFNQDWSKFIDGLQKAQKYCFIYLSNGYTDLNWETMTNDLYQEYITYFDTTETKYLKEQINKLEWTEIKEIDIKYQQIFEVLYTFRGIENLTLDQIDIKKIYKDSDPNEKNEFIFIANSSDENEGGEENENNGENEGESKHKISGLSLLYIKYTYKILNVFVSTANDDIKDEISDKLFKTTKEVLIDTNNLIINNKNNTQNKIDNKKIALYYSDLIVMEYSLYAILDLYENAELQLLFSDIRQSCVDFIIHSISLLNSVIINNFNNLQFDNYPILKVDEYNNYVKEFKKIKDVYDEITYCIDKDDMNKIFNTSFDYLFDELNKSVSNKGTLNNDESLKQFKNDFNYLSEILKSFSDINVEKYLDIIKQIINSVGPKKEENIKEKEKEKEIEKKDG